ncbi:MULTISPECIES: D-alanyl-D-alanine carboxypeptidase family protein [unclassified Niallia]|uniref:D-alanyl-D-alanine carboxypeptidase family protein n=1 Tax=unclassified Niallia TaxID=2837522 RepID=UPI001EDC2363|nr:MULTISPECIES: D-alanyl-D-alanine carboxypeptidase family protein [unclassified Niallia]MDL0434867.1 D-alanyl-D-alanine carboxypeptidase family protein [Niallia sp. SS-2023]UPO89314.1 D-alanyl-D-alanine carboxypeptidase [Niallia sp. Man26]
MKISIAALVLLSFLFASTASAAGKEEKELELKSESALLLDEKTGAVLFQKNGYKKMYPASLTKIATAIYALEKGSIDDMVMVSKHAAEEEGTSVYLETGEKVSLEKLLNGMLVNSGNDAADAVAEYLDGSPAQFEQNFNDYLKTEIKVKSTHFTNPSGLFNENHYTTAYDMALITKYALRNEAFRAIFGTKELNWDGLSWDTTLVTHHLMLKGELPYEGVNGGKTGYVDQSKQTLATSAANDGLNLIAIVLKGDWKEDVYEDTEAMFDYGFKNFINDTFPPGMQYPVAGKVFQTEKTELVTVPKDNSTPVITPTGELLMQTKAGDTIQSLQLKEKVPLDVLQAGDTLSNKEESDSSYLSIKVIAGVLVIGIIAAAVIYKKKRWQKKTV